MLSQSLGCFLLSKSRGNSANFTLPGQYFDQETGLHYNRFRDYDPSIGRYIQSDPIGLDGEINTYLYANANPLRFVDPTGQAHIGAEIDFSDLLRRLLPAPNRQFMCPAPNIQQHRGRIQVQGNITGSDVNASEPWGQPLPLSKPEAIVVLDLAVAKVPPSQLHRFNRAIARARTFIFTTSPQTAGFEISRYQDPAQGGRRGAERVDIQVFAGEAFVDY